MNKNGTFKKTILFAIAMAIALLLLSGFAMTADAAIPDITVSNEAELFGAVNNAPAGPTSYTIALENDIELTDSLTIPDGKNIVLISGEGGPFTLVGADEKPTIFIKGKLTLGTTDLDGIIVTHKKGYYGSGVEVGHYTGDSGVFIMNSGEISGNPATNMDGASTGGGVYVIDGLFKMYGGTITNNSAFFEGGGVLIGSDGNATFEMYGGTISNSRGPNVEVYGVFRMYDGEIVDNTYHGSGVRIYGRGFFEMYGGIIAGNTAYDGGGVYVNSGTFEMYGGTITDNMADYGGGVCLHSNGIFKMHSGTISDSNAYEGGGVYVKSGTFEMYGGTVSNNSAGMGGGGVGIPNNHGGLAFFKIPADAVGVVFSNNSAYDAYDRDPADDDAYAMYILGDVTWSDPFTQGYNNFDVSYEVGTPLTINTLFFEVNADDDDVEGLISDSKLIFFDKPFGILPALKRDGYVLTGWFTEAEGGEKITSSTIVSEAEDYVLYAQWTEYVDTGGDGKDSGSGIGQATIVNSKNDDKNDNKNDNINDNKNDNKTELNNSGSGKTPAPPAKGTNGGDSKDAQDTSTGGMRGALFWVMVLLTAPAIVAGFIYYKNKGKV